MKNIDDEYLYLINKNFELNKAAADETNVYLHNSTVCYHGRCVRTLQIPKIFSLVDESVFREVVDTTYGIFCKVIEAYLSNEKIRKAFPYPKEMEELIMIPRGYKCPLPIARFDIFYNEETGDFKFCEINTDGTSAMNEDFVLNQAFDLNPSHIEITQKYKLKNYELYDTWVQEFMNIYSTYDKKVENPYVAIVDFIETGSITEFEEFKVRFERAGYECEICEITELNYKNGVLYSPTGHKIDVIYRRAVTTDVYKNLDILGDFINAVKDRSVCLIGAFCTQIIHNKWLFKALREEPVASLFTQEEKEFIEKHIPFTAYLQDGYCDKNEILSNKDKWLIKPLDSYASKGVFAGCDLSEEEWKEEVLKAWGNSYIVQEYCRPYTTPNICFLEEPVEFKPYTNMSGLFVYNGKFHGVYSRLSDGGIISSQYNEKSVPTYILEDIKL